MTNESINTNKIFSDLKVPDIPVPATHINWDRLSDIFTDMLSALLGRKITAEAIRADHYEWSVILTDTVIFLDDIRSLKTLTNKDWLDYNVKYEETGTEDVDGDLCGGLMARLLPFRLECSFADDNGVWFVGSEQKNRLEKPLPNGDTLIAEKWDEPEFPGIRLYLQRKGKESEPDETVCFAEFNTCHEKNKEFSVCVYSKESDEPVYYECYNDKQPESPNN